MSTQQSLREQITARIVDALKTGVAPWRPPWTVTGPGGPANAVSRQPYSGVNPILLRLTAGERGYRSRWWGTFRQWADLGFRVRPRPAGVEAGTWGTRILLCKPVACRQVGNGPPDPGSRYLLLRQYVVFSAEQVEGRGITEYLDHPVSTFDEFGPAEKVLAGTGADIRYGGGRAGYSPAADHIRLPPRASFDNPADFYATAFHELVHWTGHSSRLNRPNMFAPFESAAYAREELLAEIGSAYLAAEIGVPQSEDMTGHAAYLHHWLAILQADPTVIFSAAGQASAAVGYLLGRNRTPAGHVATEPFAAGV